MRKNNTGLTILETGDVVRVGKGRVHYTVVNESVTGFYWIKSFNTEKVTQESQERLTLVQSVQDAAYEAGCSVEELTGVAAKASAIESGEGFPEDVPVKETSAYAKAVLFALNRLQKHIYAGTVSRQDKARRRSLNRRQKASRKANR